MAYTEFEFDTYSSNIGSKLDSMQSEVKDKIDELLSEVKVKGPYCVSKTSYISQIGEVTFDSIERARNLLGEINFIPIETRNLLPEEEEAFVTHTYISNRIDTIEANLLSIIAAGGTENIKSLSAVMIDQNLLTDLMNGAYAFENNIRNTKQRLLNVYTSENSSGNNTWMNDIYNLSYDDRKRKIVQSMFDLAQESYNWAVEKAVNIEGVHSSFTSQYNNVISTVVDANIEAYKADTMANISKLEFDLEELDAKLEVKAIEVDSATTESELSVDQYNARLSSYATIYSKNVSENMHILAERMDGVNAAADAYQKIIVGYAQRFGAVSVGRQ